MSVNLFQISRSFLLFGALSGLALPVLAEPVVQVSTPRGTLTPVTLSARDIMSRSLVTVQTVTLLRDRGVLDEAQRARVANLERDLGAALAARDAVSTNVGLAQTRLEQARQAFNAEVTILAAANQGLVREIEALRSDTITQAGRLSEEEVSQRQRFADGDTRALDVMDALATQREAAIDLAAKQRRAESRRDMARNFAIAVGRGDPGRTSADVLARWDEAAALDPSDFWTHIQRVRLAQNIGNLAIARAAVQDALRSAASDRDRSMALGAVGNIAMQAGELDEARTAYTQSLAISRARLAADPNSGGAQADISTDLEKIGNVAMEVDDFETARAAYEEALGLARGLFAANPSSVQVEGDLTSSLDRFGDVLFATNNPNAARRAFEEALALRLQRAALDPTSSTAKRDLIISYHKISGVDDVSGNNEAAIAGLTQALAIARALSQADPSSLIYKLDVVTVLIGLARLPGGGVRWAEVVAHYRTLSDAGILPAYHQRFMENAQRRANEQGLAGKSRR